MERRDNKRRNTWCDEEERSVMKLRKRQERRRGVAMMMKQTAPSFGGSLGQAAFQGVVCGAMWRLAGVRCHKQPAKSQQVSRLFLVCVPLRLLHFITSRARQIQTLTTSQFYVVVVVVVVVVVRQSDKISTLLTEETLLKTPLIISVALENSRGERAKCF
ncbi:hypothetical protein E2C01_000791 [Portunus trituberculatus]|uniref:Uncharacterized protein n=1 Tax=Portunus trituberculatus TaxID=210409 RepID=A0A5B7CHJ6_PORTR|nr:hypothetical protein [Portunus trituberculatus]